MREAEHSGTADRYGPFEFRLGDELRGERATMGKSLLDVQRDLRIKAAYIAAIENCEPEVFPNPSFVAGYVRSYSRYLGRDPDEVYWRFCQESGFAGAKGVAPTARAAAAAAATGGAGSKQPAAPGAGSFRPDFILATPRRGVLSEIPLSAIGSIAVLLALIGGLGYGGWSVLQNIQRVQFAPVDEIPVALSEVPMLVAPEGESAEPVLPELASPVAASALADLYRQQELEVPILSPRDGPIAAIDPDKFGVLARARPETAVVSSLATTDGRGVEVETAAFDEDGEAAVTVETAPARLTVVAERPAWIRVYLASGTVIFERILESGEIYEVPDEIDGPRIWAGNSGSVYVRLGDDLRGPLGSGTRAVRDVVLEPAAIEERYRIVDEVPAVISEAIGGLAVTGNVLIQ